MRSSPWEVVLRQDFFFRRTVWDHLNEVRGITLPTESDYSEWEGIVNDASTATEALDKATQQFGPPPRGLSYAVRRTPAHTPLWSLAP